MSDEKIFSDAHPVPDTKAVAIKKEGDQAAPKITAKGHGFTAEKILDIAFADGVKVRQDKDLVELLDAFEVDCPVPLEALHAVSLILERVYEENSKMAGTGPPKPSSPAPGDTVERSDRLISESTLDQNKKENH